MKKVDSNEDEIASNNFIKRHSEALNFFILHQRIVCNDVDNFNVFNSNHEAEIASLKADIERLSNDIERKNSIIFNFRFRFYLESLIEVERQITVAFARSSTTELLKTFFDKVLSKAIIDFNHLLHAVQFRYHQASDRADLSSS